MCKYFSDYKCIKREKEYLDHASALLLTTVVILVAKNIEQRGSVSLRHLSRRQFRLQDVSINCHHSFLPFDFSPNPEIALIRGEVPRPDTDLASLVTDITDQSADQLHVLAELFPDRGDDNLQPNEIHQLLRTAFLNLKGAFFGL